MDEEYSFITEVLLPSLLAAAAKIKEAKDFTPSAGIAGEPAVLVLTESGSLLISCTIYTEGTEVYRYQVEEPGKWKLSFPSLYLPEKLEFFPYLPVLYERIRFGERVPAQKDERTETEKRVAEMYERTRLPALKEILSELGIKSGEGRKEDGNPCLVAVEGDRLIRFYYDYTFPELRLTVLVIASSDEEILIPEYGNPESASYYEELFRGIF